MRFHVHRFVRPAVAAAALAAAVAAAGCGSKDRSPDPIPQALDAQGESNRTMLNMAFTRQARNAIAEERAVYPYHFEPGSARLNELGERQVEVLAHEYGDADIRVALVRGDADDALFDARTAAVRQGLTDAGMAAGQVAVAESQPGGRGLSSTQVQLMLAEEDDLGAAAGGGSATGVRTSGGQ